MPSDFWRIFDSGWEWFGLSLHPEKTRLIEFGRFAAVRRAKCGKQKPETFNFWGLHSYLWAQSEGRVSASADYQTRPDASPREGREGRTAAANARSDTRTGSVAWPSGAGAPRFSGRLSVLGS